MTGVQTCALPICFGFAPAAWHGWKALAEGENIVAADGDAYSQSGLNPGGAGRAVVADPEVTELNQLYVGYTRDHTTVTVGRQRLVLDNARFIGDSGWRQDMQTFDAVVVQESAPVFDEPDAIVEAAEPLARRGAGIGDGHDVRAHRMIDERHPTSAQIGRAHV